MKNFKEIIESIMIYKDIILKWGFDIGFDFTKECSSEGLPYIPLDQVLLSEKINILNSNNVLSKLKIGNEIFGDLIDYAANALGHSNYKDLIRYKENRNGKFFLNREAPIKEDQIKKIVTDKITADVATNSIVDRDNFTEDEVYYIISAFQWNALILDHMLQCTDSSNILVFFNDILPKEYTDHETNIKLLEIIALEFTYMLLLYSIVNSKTRDNG
ncbi:hypothetical protein ACQPU1_08360 [Clostridium paraputrificum]|uniref:hypothetical protein n=1 Tax=Clostridium paraputrificum TaxID=29363 RepID=UPI003D34629F